MKLLNLQSIKNMTIDTKKGINIPSWAVAIIIPLIIAIGGYAIGIATIDARTSVKIEHIEAELIRIEANKASVESVQNIIKSLDRIETKLDKHIELSNGARK